MFTVAPAGVTSYMYTMNNTVTNTPPRNVHVWITQGETEWGAQSPESPAFLATAPTRAALEAKLPDVLGRHFGQPCEFTDIGPAP